MSILVAGAMGKICNYLVKDLRPFVRNRSKTEAAFNDLAAEYAEGKREDAFAKGECQQGPRSTERRRRLFILFNNYAHEVELAKAAVAANVKHIVYLCHGKAEEAILSATAGKAAVTILRPHAVLPTIARVGMIKLAHSNQGSAALSSISARNIAGVLTMDISAHPMTAEVIGKLVQFVGVGSAAIGSLKANMPEIIIRATRTQNVLGDVTRELSEEGYSGVEVRVTPARTEIIIRATRTQDVLGDKGRRI
ncbi:hypothetical protein HDU96_001748, partial [Phlyctochytrium bullatum]